MNEEEKTIEEQTETIIDAIETEDDVREAFELNHEEDPVTPDEIEEVKDLVREVRELRGGLRGAADPNMIQKHLDNFLAKIAGETPVDEHVRSSAEYWLDRIADRIDNMQDEIDGIGPLYYHPITVYTSGGGSHFTLILLNSVSTAYTAATLITALAGYARICPLTGIYKHTDDTYHISLYAVWNVGQGKHRLIMHDMATGAYDSGFDVFFEDILNTSGTSVDDLVNKIV